MSDWRAFEAITRLSTNEAKNQYWGRTPAAVQELSSQGLEAGPTVQVLGVSLGGQRRPLTEHESNRREQGLSLAHRVGLLPCSYALRQRLAATVVAPKVTWGLCLNGRKVTAEDRKHLEACFHAALRGAKLGAGRAAKGLRNVLSYGHCSSADVVTLGRALRAVSRWTRIRAQEGAQVAWSASLRECARPLAQNCGPWQVTALGIRRPGAQFRFADRNADQLKSLHTIRADWRQQQVSRWLQTDRIDARLAREQRLRVTPQLVQALHEGVRRHDGFAVGVATGGFKSPAVEFQTNLIAQECPFCGRQCVLGLQHVLWHCPRFDDLRCCPRPASELAARLGWDQRGIHREALAQMGRVRKRVLSLTKADWR